MNKAIALTLALLSMAAPAPTIAQDAEGTEDARRVRGVVIFGNDPCPKGATGEIVVCARRPEEERYRIPPEIRREMEVAAVRTWQRRAREVDSLGRAGIGSCSTVGPGGSAGCTLEAIQKGMQDQQR